MHLSEAGKPYFDLVVIDEAHYFRHKESDSFRVNAATRFFGDPSDPNSCPIADKVLLLTATPNHSSSRDILKIVSYFTTQFDTKNYQEILDTICIRRLRRLGINSLNKYNYRKEIESESNFNNNPLSELFFALYQHELAKKVNKDEQDRKKKGGGSSRMLKYLEGVEFIPTERSTAPEEGENENLHNDFNVGSDTDILLELSQTYQTIFGNTPSHPKYDKWLS